MVSYPLEVLKNYATGKKIAVAVSGGRDSMCLLHLVLNASFIDRSDVLVINVEHGLRGENSERDSNFVRAYCDERGVKSECFHADVPARQKASGRGAEEEARLARREIFKDILNSGKAQMVLTAHHRSDNAETVLAHLLRGSGIGGLRGMEEITKDGLLRPLLTVSRAEINEYVRQNNIPFVEDETNGDDTFTRNFLRAQVLPLLNERFNAEDALMRVARAARRDDDFILSRLDMSAVERISFGAVRIPEKYLRLEPALSSRYALAMLRMFVEDYTASSVDAVIEAAKLESGGKREISGGLIAVNEYGFVTLCREDKTAPSVTPLFGGGRKSAGSAAFAVGEFDCGMETVEIRECAPPFDDFGAMKADGLNRTLMIDADKMPNGAVIRYRMDGDRFEPFGGGRRKLKEYFIDRKIPQRLRSRLPLVCVGSEVLAVFGVEIARSLAVIDGSGRAYRLSVREKAEAT